ncbi:DUF6894 family protein [Rhizobium terrae]|uniref:DUF6894 family protein n=1 Tax=Rhizobium terrae TaxID=2171756 RepID=UPI000E3C4E88|nr:hypothetical protein [Rhizobium terrae]
MAQFDLMNGEGLVRDEQGQEMPESVSISREVSRTLADIASEELPNGGKGTITIEIRDERGRAGLRHQSFIQDPLAR